MKSAVVLAATCTFSVFVAAQSPISPPTAERPRFEAASVKRKVSPDAGMSNRVSPGRFTYTNTRLDSFIYMAYGTRSELVIDIPAWARAEKYDITATYNPQLAAPFSRAEREMLQQLLEDRFALRLHRETRDMPVYELVRARADGELGPALRVATLDCSPANKDNRSLCGTRIDSNLIAGKGVDWRMVLGQLPGAVGRTVIDRTGLQGMFEVGLEWKPDPSLMQSPEAVAMATAAAAAAPGDAVPIFTAVQEQLGLKLQAARAPLEVIVIDRLERPTSD